YGVFGLRPSTWTETIVLPSGVRIIWARPEIGSPVPVAKAWMSPRVTVAPSARTLGASRSARLVAASVLRWRPRRRAPDLERWWDAVMDRVLPRPAWRSRVATYNARRYSERRYNVRRRILSTPHVGNGSGKLRQEEPPARVVVLEGRGRLVRVAH